MGNDDDDAAAGTNAEDCRRQSLFTVAVEIGVGLVQNDQEGIAIECAGERNPLALAG